MKKQTAKFLSITLVFILLFISVSLSTTADTGKKGTKAEVDPALQNTQSFIVKELEDYRDEFSKTYLNSDNTISVIQSSQPLHFKTAELDKWQDIDNSLSMKKNQNNLHVFENGNNRFSVSLPQQLNDTKIDIHNQSYNISIEHLNVDNTVAKNIKNAEKATFNASQDISKMVQAFSQSDKLLYSNAYDSTDIEYTVGVYGVKESIVLQQMPKGPVSYHYFIQTNGLAAKLNHDKSIIFFEADHPENVVFLIPAPYMFDDVDTQSIDIITELKPLSDGFELIYTPNLNWLQSTDRKYPITVDPTVIMNNNTVQSAYAFSASDYAEQTLGWEQQLKIGIDTWLGFDYYEAYIKFNDFQSVINKYPQYDITEAQLILTERQVRFPSALTINAFEVKGYWNADVLTYNNRPSCYSNILSQCEVYGAKNKFSWDITTAARDWAEHPFQNQGIALKVAHLPNEGLVHKIFHSTRTFEPGTAPYLLLKFSLNDYIEEKKIESSHPYENHLNQTYTISAKPGTKKMRVHFSYIETEPFYDYIEMPKDSWSGSLKDVWSEWYYDDHVELLFKSDDSGNGEGFLIDKIECFLNCEDEWTTTENYNCSYVEYEGNAQYHATIHKDGAKALRLHFRNLDTEIGADFLELSVDAATSTIENDKLHGTRTGVWSSWFPSNTIRLSFSADETVHGYGFVIDKIQYTTKTVSDFPWKDYQFNEVGPFEKNPDMGDGQNRLADRLNHLPSEGSVAFEENKYITTNLYDHLPYENRSVTVNFKWSPDRLRNLVRDGNETYELEVNFYNSGSKGDESDPYGRPADCFNPWIKLFGEDAAVELNSRNDEFIKYTDSYFGNRGSYFYRTNLGQNYTYPDTLFMDDDTVSLCIGISDAQYLLPNFNYYYEIIAAKNKDCTTGIFSLIGQRGYRYDHHTMPNDAGMTYFVFNEESDNYWFDGYTCLIKSPWYDSTKNTIESDNFRLDRIISSIDNRADQNLLAKKSREICWNSNGALASRNIGSSDWHPSSISRNWDKWNTNWFAENIVFSPEKDKNT